jgi:hypothetical protein
MGSKGKYGILGFLLLAASLAAQDVDAGWPRTAAGKTSNGDMYATHDGNVYKNTGSGR